MPEQVVYETVGVITEELNHLEQDNPRLVEAVRDRYMYRPSKEPYNLGESPSLTGQFGMVSGKMFVLFVQCGGGFTGQWTTEQVQLNNFSGTNY